MVKVDAATEHRQAVQDLIDDAVDEIERDRRQTALVIETVVLRGYLRGLLKNSNLGDDIQTPVVAKPPPTTRPPSAITRRIRRPRGVSDK